MDDITRFINHRLDEDERTARAATDGPWTIRFLGRHDLSTVVRGNELLAQLDGSRAASNSVHMAIHNPARVLAEVAAKRRMLGWLASEDEASIDSNDWAWDSDRARRILAMPYADHPDYDTRWAL